MNTSELLKHIAMVSDSPSVRMGEVARVSAALQRQVQSHLSRVWEINATVDAFERLEDVPIDYWPVIIRDDIDVPNAAGIHLDQDGQPFALVQHSSGWSLTASHEVLEMLCDPFGNRVKAGPSPMPGQGRVNFLVEVCDPSEAVAYGYTINGVTVSDFYTPSYFDPIAVAGVRYSWTGAIEAPRQVLKGGYISWHDPVTDEWFQQVYFDNEPAFRSLGRLSARDGSIRSAIYARTPEAHKSRQLPAAMALMASGESDDVVRSCTAKAQLFRSQINQLLGRP
ncbi:hypothetical protein [Massilia sp. ZL223]|uniref:hypothetical protein n=1 Tax=Massilia sp. ZL223 TaxID=2824904 RepID=UPI001B8192D0|nr:hypothetical protein [Massilia sp. ZL223]MBQ5964347.1 hypothetical protein [Massilia sp. ZL223]